MESSPFVFVWGNLEISGWQSWIFGKFNIIKLILSGLFFGVIYEISPTAASFVGLIISSPVHFGS